MFTVSLFSWQATGNYFEVAIVNKMESDKEITVRSRGTCMKCGTKGSDCGLRSCPDISGLYKGVPFVVDCKNYASYAYIKDSDVAKIISDKEQGKNSIYRIYYYH